MSHVLLTRANGPRKSLLGTIGGQKRQDGGVRQAKTKIGAQRASPDTYADPLSSTDEEEEGVASNAAEHELPLDDGSNGLRPLAQSQGNGPASSPPNLSSSSPRRPRGARRTTSTTSSSPKRRADALRGPPLLDDDFDMFSSSQSQRRAKKIKSYGGRNIRAARAAATAVVGSRTDDAAVKPGSKEASGRTNGFKAPVLERDVEDQLSRIEKRSSSSRTFRVPSNMDKADDDERPKIGGQGPAFKKPVTVVDLDIDGTPARRGKGRPRRSARSGGAAAQERDEVDLTGARSSGVVDGFNAPASSGTTDLSTASILVDLDLSSDSSSLSSLSDSAILGSDDEGFLDDMRASSSSFSTFIGNNNNSNNNNKNSKKKAKSKANTVVCPMCFESVPDAHEIESLPRLDLGRLPLREQKRFCRMHKIHAAQRQWRRCGYPDIQWADLPGRVDALVPQLADVVTGRKHSYYRQLLEDAVMAGGRRNQSAVQAFMVGDLGEGLSPGYYGPRGAQIFEQSILSAHSSAIRQRAATDRVMASRGVSSYVQTVLVPELAVLLIKDDMQVNDAEARTILNESAEIGELLCEDV